MNPLLVGILSVFLASAHAEGKGVPEFEQSFRNSGCTQADNPAWSPWHVFDEVSWAELEDDDKRAVYDAHCKGGSVLFSFAAAEKALVKALGDDGSPPSNRLRQLEDANADSKQRTDIVCNGRLSDGRKACAYCCKRLMHLREQVVKLENSLAVAERGKQKITHIQDDGSLKDMKGLSKGHAFDGAKEREEPKHRDFSDKTVVDTKDEKPKAGALREKDESLKKYSTSNKPPPPLTMSAKEEAWVAAQADKWVFGTKWLGAREARDDIEHMHGYIKHCYDDGSRDGPCVVCRNKVEIDPEEPGYCKGELIKRQLGR